MDGTVQYENECGLLWAKQFHNFLRELDSIFAI